MRQPRLKIKKFIKNGYTFYGIHVPPFLNVENKAGYYYYHTRAEAERGRIDLLQTLTQQRSPVTLSPEQQTDALRAMDLLRENNLDISLLEAIEAALPHLKAAGSAMTVDTLCKDFAELKAASWSTVSARNFRRVTQLFLEEFSGRTIASITSREIQTWLSARFPTPGYQLNTIRNLRPAFNYAVRQDLIHASPFDKLESIRARARATIDIFTPEEAARLMSATTPETCAAFALLLFAGIRPAELTRLTWSNIRDGYIHITPDIAKTAQVRNVEIEPTLAKWLASTGPHQPGESICPPIWRYRREEVVKAAGLDGRKDTPRHSYASYYLAKYQNADALKMNMGHSRSSDTLFAHYRAAATPSDAEKYWSILP